MNTSPISCWRMLARAAVRRAPHGPPPRADGTSVPEYAAAAQGYSKLNQQVSEINQEQSTIERTATDRRHNMAPSGRSPS